MGSLMILSEGLAGREFALAPGANTVGRRDGNSILIPHDSVSGAHGVLE